MIGLWTSARDAVASWLLEKDNPAVRYRTLVQLFDCAPDEPPAVDARESIPEQTAVRRILDAEWPDGYWMHPDVGYSPKHKATVWQIIFLAQVGLARCGQVERAVEHLLSHALVCEGTVLGSEVSEARFTAQNGRLCPVLCLNGNLLRALLWFGYGADPRVRAIRLALLEQVHRESFRCRFNGRLPSGSRPTCMAEGLPCAWGAIKVMGAYLAIPAAHRTAAEQEAVDTGISFLLSHDLVRTDFPTSGRPSRLWFRFGFPLGYTSDMLELLEVMGRACATGSENMRPAVDRVWRKRNENGRWLLEWEPNNMWASFDQMGCESKWVTLRALVALRPFYGEGN